MFSATQYAHCLVLLFTSTVRVLAVESASDFFLGGLQTGPNATFNSYIDIFLKCTFNNSPHPIKRYVSAAAAATALYSARKKVRGQREKKNLRSAASVLHAIPKDPNWGETEKGRPRVWGLQKKEQGRKTLTHYLWQENHPRAERHLGYQYRALFSFDSCPHSRCQWQGNP